MGRETRTRESQIYRESEKESRRELKREEIEQGREGDEESHRNYGEEKRWRFSGRGEITNKK